ncbi:MAG: 30S ribosome-binding factor RbfA [Puniceicoccales bacterium]|jgi:ribosome-binding factor A|nr:30S ribosome-binding factor RbfA [Puniceicoccales bacterium]
MSQERLTRLNRLVCHEFNSILRTLYRDDLFAVTVTEVQISPDLHDAYAFVSILGDGAQEQKMLSLLIKKLPMIRKNLFSKISLKYSPHLNLRLDRSASRAHRVLAVLDSIFHE